MSQYLGDISAYALAVSHGYTGTEEEYAELMASYATVGQTAVTAAQTATTKASEAATSATTATTKASEATTAATTATTKAGEASTSASTATSAKDTAVSASQTATAKATEATTAAATATSAKTDAVAANTAAQSAKTAAQTAQAGAETAAASVQSSAAQIQTNADDISELKEELNKSFPVEPINTTIFENLNYGVPSNVIFYNDRFPDSDGKITPSNTTSSIVVSIKPNTTYYLYVPSRNRQIVVETSDDFTVGETYTKLAVITTPHLYNGINVIRFTTGSSATKIMAYIYAGTYDYEANKDNFIITATAWNPDIQPNIMDEYIPKREIVVTPRETTFFDSVNYFSEDTVTYYADRFLDNANGQITVTSSVNSISFQCEPNTEYYIYIPNNNRGVIGESSDGVFETGTTLNLLYAGGMSAAPYHVTTSANAKYIFVYFYSGTYDYETNKNNIVLNIDKYTGSQPPYIPYKYLPTDLEDVLDNTNVLIFGDSITDTCNITIDANDQTSAYTWRNPSNSYVNEGGATISYSMWPKILKESQKCNEIRNYARSGASYKTQSRTTGEERQNLQYQIDVALNDLDNPNNVFSVNDFVPDIVIFALGTNDGTPNDTYDSAMNKTVYQSDGYSIDVAATLTALDDTKVFESARKAFLRIKQAFPLAQIFCVLPIQRANNDVNLGDLHNDLKKMAGRYGCVIIDGALESGIPRDFNNWNALGLYLKDGLHPNEKGQNLMSRMIIASLKSHYLPFGYGFN